ncbi:MAG: alginate export family protein [Planctomycetaceae bacterium]|nr:alginate export family protein [Planctomycetaceae bacterium]
MGLFYLNDYRYLSDPCYEGHLLGDSLKRIDMPHCGKLDIGGQFRSRYHYEQGMKGPQRFLDTTDEFMLTRLRLFANYEVNDWLRFYSEGIYADSGHEFFPARGIDENYGDLLNLFVDVKLTDRPTARVGRQELLYGAQRVVSPLDWANTRRTFEGLRLLYRTDDWDIDGFYTQFVPVDRDDFDEAESAQSFYGTYAVYSGIENVTLDAYYLGAENDLIGQSLHTIGGRYFETFNNWMLEVEGAIQFGDRRFGINQDGEGFATVGVGRKLSDAGWKPTVWAYFDYASKNYNQLFPLAHKYFGFIDAVQRANIESPNLLVTAKPNDRLTLLAWYHHFQSHSAQAVPSIGGTPAQNGSKYLGNELDLLAKYQLTPRSDLLFGWSHCWRGNKIDNPEDADFFYTQFQLSF